MSYENTIWSQNSKCLIYRDVQERLCYAEYGTQFELEKIQKSLIESGNIIIKASNTKDAIQMLAKHR